MRITDAFLSALREAAGEAHVLTDAASCAAYGVDALKKGHPAGVVVRPATTEEVSAVLRVCTAHGVPVVPRGAGTGYTGGAVPITGGAVLSLERFTRILEIDEANLLAVVEPHVITGDLQAATARVGLYYPPDPASLDQSTIGGNVAECAGGPRAFKYGVTRRYVLGLEAVLPDGQIIRTGGKSVKNVVGYDLTQLLVGSEGTLAVITKIIVRLVPLPPAQATVRATFADIGTAARAVTALIRARVVPAAIELIDADTLQAVVEYLPGQRIAPDGTGALLLIEVDGLEAATREEAARVEQACREVGASEVLSAFDAATQESLWEVRRVMSFAVRAQAPLKINHDVVVPKGRIPELFALIDRLKAEFDLRIPSFGHAGDGNIHVNIMVDPADEAMMARARAAERALFEGTVALEGSITGEHGIGFSKLPFLSLEVGEAEVELMRRIKAAFDPAGLLNPGKVLPPRPH